MSRDYKPSPERTKKPSKGSPFFSGLLVGFLLGVAASLAVVMYIKGGESPFAAPADMKEPLSVKIAEDAKKSAEAENQKPADAATDSNDKTRFDFYTILPGSESKVTTDELNIKDHQPQPVVQYTYYLQVGAFKNEQNGNRLLKRIQGLALVGNVAVAKVYNDGLYRVKLGPYAKQQAAEDAAAQIRSLLNMTVLVIH